MRTDWRAYEAAVHRSYRAMMRLKSVQSKIKARGITQALYDKLITAQSEFAIAEDLYNFHFDKVTGGKDKQ